MAAWFRAAWTPAELVTSSEFSEPPTLSMRSRDA
jgi:hypothetical protein